jgi:hypothetical protein
VDTTKAYDYLGIEESHDLQHKNEKEKLKKEYLRRLRLVLDIELSAKNEIQAIGALAVAIQAILVLRQGYAPAKCRANRTQTSQLKPCIAWGLGY